MGPMTFEPTGGGDAHDGRAWLLTGVDADFWEPALGGGHTEVDSVVVTLSGDDAQGNRRSQRFVVPTGSWDEVSRYVRRVIRSQEMGRALRAAGLLDSVDEPEVIDEDPWAEFEDAERFERPPTDEHSHLVGSDDAEPEGFDDADWVRYWVAGAIDPEYDDYDEDEDDEDAPGEDDEGFTAAEMDEAWAEFGPRLASVLEVLEPGHVLVLSAPSRRFVQLVVERGGARIETVGNQFLHPINQMTMDDLEVLAESGWNPPTHFADQDIPHGGSPNHHRQLAADWSRPATAELMVSVLRTLHQVEMPSDLVYRALAMGQGQILLPTLGVPRHQHADT